MSFPFLNKKKFFSVNIFLLSVILIGILISHYINFNLSEGLLGIPSAFQWMIENFIPTKESLTKLPGIMRKIIETIALSIAATTTGGIFALFLSFFGSRVTTPSSHISFIARIIAAIFRNIPNAVWAMVLLLSFGQNILTGYFALFFVSFGFLSRAFIETLDELGSDTIEALTSVGASYIQVLFKGILPSVTGQFSSWLLYMVETNIRSSTLIGMLTGTGIGFLFDIYYKSSQYSAAGLVVVVITVTILIIECISNFIRRRLC